MGGSMSATTNGTRAVLYLRLSDSDDASTSIARQREDLTRLADDQGWEIVAEYVDDGLSGRKARANAEAAMAAVQDREADVLACWKFDRFSRQGLLAVAQLIETVDSRPGVLFVALKDNLWSSMPMWRIIAAVLSEVARTEAENTSLRVLSSQRKLVQEGRYVGGPVVYGYESAPHPSGAGRVLVVNPDEARVVHEVADKIILGESLRGIAADLNNRSVPTRYGKQWTSTSVKVLMTNEALLGRVVRKGQVVRDDDGMPVTMWEPLLSESTFNRLRAKLIPTSKRPKEWNRKKALGLLSGVVKCAHCHSPMYYRPRSGRPGEHTYVCMSRNQGKTNCPGCSVAAEPLEELVTDRILTSWGDREVMVREVVDNGAAERATVEAGIAATLESLGATDDDDETAALLHALNSLKRRRAALADVLPTERWAGTGQTYGEAWNDGNLRARQTLLRDAMGPVMVRKGVPGRRGFDAGRVRMIDRVLEEVGPHTRDGAVLAAPPR